MSRTTRQLGPCAAAALLLLGSRVTPAEDAAASAPTGTAAQTQSLEELRNTVINLLQALVDKGLLTREQAQLLVKQAQDKAALDAAQNAATAAAQAKAQENSVRVPYVPQIVKDEISKQVAAQVQPAVVQSVVAEAKSEKWGIPAALPDWLAQVRPFGDVTFRGQADMYAADNAVNAIYDYNGINAAGGIAKDAFPFLNTSENRDRFRLRARLGLDAQLGAHALSEIRLSSGSLTDPSSESQTEGTYSQRYSVAFDRAYIRWNSNVADALSAATVEGGRLESPWFAPTELVYARDLQFEGVASSLRLGFGRGEAQRSYVYASLAAVPILEVPLEYSENKWLFGGQLGANLRLAGGADRLQFAAAYYDFDHVTGVRNPLNSTVENPTAPAFIRYGNTVYNIANIATDPTTQLWALAAHFRLVDVAARLDLGIQRRTLSLLAEGVRNIGYDRAAIEAFTGIPIASPQDKGYVGELSFGDPTVTEFGHWRAAVGYRYVQSDAVIDAWTDADFHEAGTNAVGYYLWGDLGLANNTWLRVRYLSGNEITGPRYGVDILQLDMNVRF
jgi:hypothetical protein